jgi:hypothetical protein
MARFVFAPPADHASGLLTLPWSEPLAQWQDARLVEVRQRGISRHVVRFVYDDGVLYALKELSERLARREYRLLRALAELNIPAVEVVGIVVGRDDGRQEPGGPDAILVTKFLSYATTYRAVFSDPRGCSRLTGCLTRWWNSWSGCTCPGSTGVTARCRDHGRHPGLRQEGTSGRTRTGGGAPPQRTRPPAACTQDNGETAR